MCSSACVCWKPSLVSVYRWSALRSKLDSPWCSGPAKPFAVLGVPTASPHCRLSFAAQLCIALIHSAVGAGNSVALMLCASSFIESSCGTRVLRYHVVDSPRPNRGFSR